MYNDPIGGTTLGGLATANINYARTQASQREYLALEVEQQKINLRHAELRLKQHDEWEADRAEQEAMAKSFNPAMMGAAMKMGQAE